MGDNTLTTVVQGTAGSVEQLNQYKEALSNDLLPRDTQGAVADEAGSLGRETAQFKDIYYSGDIFRNGVRGGSVPSGCMFPYTGSTTVAPSGYIFADGKTIGNDGSGADYEGSEYAILFELYKVVSEYGNTGTEDFYSGDTVKIPNLNGRFVRSIGSENPDGSVMGETQGDQNKSHSHVIDKLNFDEGQSGGGVGPDYVSVQNSMSTNADGGDEARPKSISFPYIVRV